MIGLYCDYVFYMLTVW